MYRVRASETDTKVGTSSDPIVEAVRPTRRSPAPSPAHHVWVRTRRGDRVAPIARHLLRRGNDHERVRPTPILTPMPMPMPMPMPVPTPTPVPRARSTAIARARARARLLRDLGQPVGRPEHPARRNAAGEYADRDRRTADRARPAREASECRRLADGSIARRSCRSRAGVSASRATRSPTASRRNVATATEGFAVGCRPPGSTHPFDPVDTRVSSGAGTPLSPGRWRFATGRRPPRTGGFDLDSPTAGRPEPSGDGRGVRSGHRRPNAVPRGLGEFGSRLAAGSRRVGTKA